MIRWIQNVSKKWLIAAVAVLAVIAVVGASLINWGGVNKGQAAQPSAPAGAQKPGAAGPRQFPVETQIVKLSDVSGGQVFTGSITPIYTTNVSSRVSGRVVELAVKPGDRVKVGQPLAKIDTSTLQQQIAQSESALTVSAAQLQRAANDQANSVTTAEKLLAVQRANFDKAIADQQNSVASAQQQVALSQANYNKAVSDQQNSIASAKQTVAISLQNLNNAINTYNINLSNAQNALNTQQDTLQTSQSNTNNSQEGLRLKLQQAIINYSNASQNGKQSDIDTALQKLQQAQLDLDQAQQTTPSALTTATGALLKAQNDLASAQSSQSVQIVQEQLNRDSITLANAQNTLLATMDTSQQTLQKDQLALAAAQSNQQISVNVSKAQLDQQEQALTTAKSTDAIAISSAQYKQSQTNLQVLNEQLQDGVLLSPVDGVVSIINTPVGQNANAQANIMSIAALVPAQATVNISEANIGKIKVGMEMKVNVPTLGKSFDGVVSSIRPTMDPTTKAYGVDIKLNDLKGELLPGMFATSNLSTQGGKAIMVPADAILSQPSGNAAFIVKDGRAKKVSVKVGALSSSLFEITSGLAEGDELVVTGQELLSDKAAVQIVKPGQDANQGTQQDQSGQKQQQKQQQGQQGQKQQDQGGQKQQAPQGQKQGQAEQNPQAQPGQGGQNPPAQPSTGAPANQNGGAAGQTGSAGGNQ